MKKKYDIAAYIWPAYTGDEPRTRIFWPEGFGEWETVKAARACYPGHLWPRKPVWGYVNEADPRVMEMEIDAAADHGVNVFIYDWYWFDNRPFLEQCLNNGFLKARNRSRMKFYLMWANHDVTYGWDRRIASEDYGTHIWKGAVTREQFQTIGHRLLEQYFPLPEYYKIDNKPVLSIYELQNLMDGMGGAAAAKDALLWLDQEAKKQGFDGIHYQYIKFGSITANLSGFDHAVHTLSAAEITSYFPFSSVTHYQFTHFCNMNRNYSEILSDVKKEWDLIDRECQAPFFPHVSVGWDNTPRYGTASMQNVTKNNPPAEFEKALQMAKAYADAHNVRLITINSWNEWTESSYLQPDNLYGYGYLEAIQKIFG